MIRSVYVIGSLRSPKVPLVAKALREAGYDVFDDWYAAGYEADDKWQQYEQERGRSYAEALNGYAAEHVFRYDFGHLERCDAMILVTPAGKSAHMEFGFELGRGKPGWVYFHTEPERWDVMYRFATGVAFSIPELVDSVKAHG